LPDNLLIEASAGTGKTQRLGERLIELLRQGVKPQEIVALTFSRLAAGEIFERFVTLLAAGAGENPEDVKLLRSVVATQHLTQIGTLDGFLARMVRAFPLELGLAGEFALMDGYRESAERSAVAFSILRRTDAATKKNFVEAFRQAMNREDVRSFAGAYRKFISDWHSLVSAMPLEESWGRPETIWGCDAAIAKVDESTLAAAADAIEPILAEEKWRQFADWVRNFRGVTAGMTGFAKKLLKDIDPFAGDVLSFRFGRKDYAFGRDETLRVRDALLAVMGYIVRSRLEYARGVYKVISAFEREYARRVRSAGKLVFADIPRLVSSLPEEKRLMIEYRLDSRIRAWALDEFQDTSREQWKALSNLIDEAKQSDGEKSLFVVGDRKQAIYGWRNGDVGIFMRERDCGAYRLEELKRTYRSGPAVVEAVNRVFAQGRIAAEFPAWKCPPHESAKPELGGFVRTIDAPGPKADDFAEPVCQALKANAGKDIATAVLVRSNTFGELLAGRLKAMGMDNVVWEGESAILDTPVLMPFLDLLQLADHPGDQVAYRHFTMTRLCRAKYPREIPPALEISREMSGSFTAKGIVRTFRELRSLLAESSDEAWSRFSEMRFTDMLRAAAEFELSMTAGAQLSDFADFLRAGKKRNVAEPGKIKIMTIHRSKGLGFDYVVLPLYEPKSLGAEPGGVLLGENWILPSPGDIAGRHVEGLKEAWQEVKDRAEQEAICAYYVAMTRAKSAMTVILHPEPKTAGGGVRFSDIVRSAGIGELGGPPVVPGDAHGKNGDDTQPLEAFVRAPREATERRLPSLSFATGQSAGELFVRDGRRRKALEHGLGVHARYEKIGWIDGAEAKSDLERALVKPGEECVLWRERAFEVYCDGVWTSGRFDRVVFSGAGQDRRAVVYDFKTNRRRASEGAGEFASRMEKLYRNQMESYRKALSALSGIDISGIDAVLLLVATGEAVKI
jgi:ATP-dependent exoDNAse (exonuclease V) beta subunit